MAEFHYVHHQPGGAPYDHLAELSNRIVAAASETGIGLTLLPVLYRHGGCGGKALQPGQLRFGNAPDRFARLREEADSNIRISLAEELRTLEYTQRLRDRARAVLARPGESTGRTLLDAVARGGAQAAMRDAGTLAPGRLADLVALDGEAADLAGKEGDALLDSFVFAGGDRLVTDAWSAGRHVVTEGRHVRHDAITRRYIGTIERLKEAL